MDSYQSPSKAVDSRAKVVPRVSQSTLPFVNNNPLAVQQRALKEAANSRQPARTGQEGSFRANPVEFLKTNLLSLNSQTGMDDRAGSNKAALQVAHDNCMKNMGRLAKHWFKLVPNARHTKRGRAAYNLTPAIEKYLQEDPESILGPIVEGKLSAEQTKLKKAIESAFPLEAETNYITSAYVDFITGNNADSAEKIGHTTITQSREHEVDFNPDFVFTATMNGCAFAVTPSETEGHFTAWHFPSTGANLDSASNFRQTLDPMDWYGVDEYDNNKHNGLFEVTNFLHRGADNQWSVISQQSDEAHQDRSLTITKVQKRRLNLGAPDKFGTIKRIYSALHKTNTDAMLHDMSKVVKNIDIFSPGMRSKLKTYDRLLNDLLTEENQRLAAATSISELNTAGKFILRYRTSIVIEPRIAKYTQELSDYLNATYEVENVKVKRNNQLASNLVNVETLLTSVLAGYRGVKAINALITETR